MTVKRIALPRRDPRLARTIVHDEASRDYPYKALPGMERISVRHRSVRRLMNQHRLGSCTAHAAVKSMTSHPFTVVTEDVFPRGRRELEKYTKGYYHDETVVDPFDGTWPPVDTGSSGLAAGKVALARGLIKGYFHAFDTDNALDAIVEHAVIMGIKWYNGMYYPDDNGFLIPSGELEGGHELCIDEINVEDKYIEGPNSWGKAWGPLDGRYRMEWDVFHDLISDDGDVTIFLPLDA